MKKVLLVEDDQSLQEIYGVRLQHEGYRVFTASDGEEALSVALKERPDLILSDVMMPKISGFDMLDIMRSTPEIKDTKVIIMTALSSDDQRSRGDALGVNMYLVKSQVGIEDIIQAVKDVLNEPQAEVTTVDQTVTEAKATEPITDTDNTNQGDFSADSAEQVGASSQTKEESPDSHINQLLNELENSDVDFSDHLITAAEKEAKTNREDNIKAADLEEAKVETVKSNQNPLPNSNTQINTTLIDQTSKSFISTDATDTGNTEMTNNSQDNKATITPQSIHNLGSHSVRQPIPLRDIIPERFQQ
ncbi:MAG: response regulator [Candidatus Saccharibacteria bacterium]|nr:response regulator [Candidatus Saccharibacteria bacterium]